MNIKENTKKKIFKILNNPYISDLPKILPNELNEIEKVFSFGRCEYFLETSNLLQKFPHKKKKKIEIFIESREINSLKIFSEFIRLAQILNSKDIKFIPLKGLHMNLQIFKDLRLRNMRDIDLLIEEKALIPYLKCMFLNGYKFKDLDINPNEFNYSDYHYDIPVLVNKNDVHVETHLRVIDSKFSSFIFSNKFKKKFSNSLSINFMSSEDLIIHLIYHATIKNGFDNGLISIFDVVNILKYKKINYEVLLDRAEALGLRKNVSCFLSMINYRFNEIKIDPKILLKKSDTNLQNYEDLILMNHADQFSFRLFSKKKKNPFSYEAFLSETGRSNIGLLDIFSRISRISFTFIKTIISITVCKSNRVDVHRVQEINNYLEDKQC